MLTPIVLNIFSDCVLFHHVFQVKSTQIYFDTYFPCISNCWAGPRGLQKNVYFNWGSTCRKVWEQLLHHVKAGFTFTVAIVQPMSPGLKVSSLKLYTAARKVHQTVSVSIWLSHFQTFAPRFLIAVHYSISSAILVLSSALWCSVAFRLRQLSLLHPLANVCCLGHGRQWWNLETNFCESRSRIEGLTTVLTAAGLGIKLNVSSLWIYQRYGLVTLPLFNLFVLCINCIAWKMKGKDKTGRKNSKIDIRAVRKWWCHF